MKLTELTQEAISLRKTFRQPELMECLYIDKEGHSHPVEHIDAAYWGTADKCKLTVLLFEEKPDETKELPF